MPGLNLPENTPRGVRKFIEKMGRVPKGYEHLEEYLTPDRKDAPSAKDRAYGILGRMGEGRSVSPADSATVRQELPRAYEQLVPEPQRPEKSDNPAKWEADYDALEAVLNGTATPAQREIAREVFPNIIPDKGRSVGEFRGDVEERIGRYSKEVERLTPESKLDDYLALNPDMGAEDAAGLRESGLFSSESLSDEQKEYRKYLKSRMGANQDSLGLADKLTPENLDRLGVTTADQAIEAIQGAELLEDEYQRMLTNSNFPEDVVANAFKRKYGVSINDVRNTTNAFSIRK